MKEDFAEFGSELRRRRDERGLSVTDFSRLIYFTKGYVSKVERGLATPSQQFAEACDKELGTQGELAALLGREVTRREEEDEGKTFAGLPAAPNSFVGRSEELTRIAECLAQEAESSVCALSGLSGAGKTALALRAAWSTAASFPDGCFFFDFGEDSHRGTRDFLESALSLLGVTRKHMPSRTDALANLWRSRISAKRLLLVLDNVRGTEDIAPLLPGESECRFIVISRKRLSALDSATHLSVGVLESPAAMELFRVVGGERAARSADPAVRTVVELCGRLPLAVCVAAARFRHGPERTMEELEEKLSDETYRLELLDDGERSVTAALTLSCKELSPEQRRLLALLALHPGPGAEFRSVTALADIDLVHVEKLINGLADVYLVSYVSPDRVALHELVRQFARQVLLPDIAIEQQQSAVRRLLEHALRRTVAADRLLTPQRYRPPVVLDDFPGSPNPFGDRAEAVAWLAEEWRVLVALCHMAARHGLHSLCWQLAFALRDYFFLTKLWGPWIETHQRAVECSRAAGTRAWLAISLGNLGVAHSDRGDLTVAVDHFRQSLALYQALEDEHGVVTTVSHLAWAQLYLGEYANALDGMRTARRYYRRLGNRRNAAITLRGIALLEAELGLCPAAVVHARAARDEFHTLGLELDVVMSVNCVAWATFRAGDYEAAATAYEEALTLAESCGSRYEQARALTGLGNIRKVSGDRGAAAELWAQADALYGGLEPVMLGEARARLTS
ncbi:tetratricopeptide repeat protein [Streptomyces sp. NPDC058319]|uniref:helix-turn-helix domain-containing protein n=1 Tax=unclassified Streptomyces TaxID=2593676 RepID=UPI0033A0ACCA